MLFRKNAASKKITYYRKSGIKIGDNFRLFDPDNTFIDTQNPKLITIGNNVMITRGVSILTHDYSWAVLSNVYDRMYGNTGSVSIGNNVFIGMNTIILKNTRIGDNVIIGAGSVVSGDVESNSVWCGVPAKKIMTLDQYNRKMCNRQMNDIINNYKFMIEQSKSNISEDDFFEYFYLFKNYSELTERELGQINRIANHKLITSKYKSNQKFARFDELQSEINKKV